MSDRVNFSQYACVFLYTPRVKRHHPSLLLPYNLDFNYSHSQRESVL